MYNHHFGTPSTSKQQSKSGAHASSSAPKASSSSLFQVEPYSVTNCALQLGLDLVEHELAQSVATAVSSQIREVFVLTKKFQKAGRRKTMGHDEFQSALAFHQIKPQLGYDYPDLISYKQVVGQTGKDLFVREDPEVDLSALLIGAPPQLPLEPYIRSHWLAISGVQPAIPENPPPAAVLAAADQSAADQTSGGEADHGKPEEETAAGATKSKSLFLNKLAKSLKKTEQVQIKSMTTHAVPLEQQVFFKEITETIVGNNEEKRKEALQYLQMDTGLNPLVPRFSVVIVEGVRCNIAMRNLPLLIYLMRMTQSLASNPHISLDRCLHDIIPAVMSCVLTRQLSDNVQSDSHWKLRDFAAHLLATLVKSTNVVHILPRITATLSRVFYDQNCPMTTLYGAIFSLNELGFETFRSVVVQKTPLVYLMLQRVKANKNLPLEGVAVERIFSFLTKTLTSFAQDSRCPFELRTPEDFHSHFGGFGDEVYRQCSSSSHGPLNNNV